jgi:hypothetical protein
MRAIKLAPARHRGCGDRYAAVSAHDIVDGLYEGLAPALRHAAAGNVLLHLRKLVEDVRESSVALARPVLAGAGGSRW